MIDVKTATTKQLVEFYNQNATQPVKKFSDRKTAERRVKQMLDAQPRTNTAHGEAIRNSWQNPDVRERRSQRHKVVVDGEEYDSVRAAFVALGLPLSKHIKFRMELKAAGQLNAHGHDWRVKEA